MSGVEEAHDRIFAIGTVNPGVDPAAVRSILPTEVRETVKLYLDGKIDQWYSQQGRSGVVFLLNVTDPTAAHDMLEKLPLGQAHLMDDVGSVSDPPGASSIGLEAGGKVGLRRILAYGDLSGEPLVSCVSQCGHYDHGSSISAGIV